MPSNRTLGSAYSRAAASALVFEIVPPLVKAPAAELGSPMNSAAHRTACFSISVAARASPARLMSYAEAIASPITPIGRPLEPMNAKYLGRGWAIDSSKIRPASSRTSSTGAWPSGSSVRRSSRTRWSSGGSSGRNRSKLRQACSISLTARSSASSLGASSSRGSGTPRCYPAHPQGTFRLVAAYPTVRRVLLLGMRRGPSRIRGIALGAVLVAASGCVGEAQRGTSPSGSVPVVTPGQAYGPFPYAAPAQRATFDAFLACAADLGVEYEGPFADSNGEGLFFRLAPGEEASHAQQRHVDRACPEFDVGAFGTRVGRAWILSRATSSDERRSAGRGSRARRGCDGDLLHERDDGHGNGQVRDERRRGIPAPPDRRCAPVVRLRSVRAAPLRAPGSAGRGEPVGLVVRTVPNRDARVRRCGEAVRRSRAVPRRGLPGPAGRGDRLPRALRRLLPERDGRR